MYPNDSIDKRVTDGTNKYGNTQMARNKRTVKSNGTMVRLPFKQVDVWQDNSEREREQGN